ncbi:MAG TPA: iron-containing alcohol dehydrogenase [Candidatus Hydrogenedentes bacterium]|nr:iron-containing alcohol dehydrogenase [Candidatus Hydrogenedentota bacterium]HPG65773.1 iron-containing alcohol dehydrogenase [Candidatus Hydrogenedentota bacterium]
MIPEYYEFCCPVKIISGKQALANLPYEMGILHARRALVVADKGVVGAGLLKRVERVFEGSGAEIAAVFDETPPDSSDRVANRVAKVFADLRCDCFVAVGGGSVLDTVKGANMVVSEGTDDLLKLQGAECLRNAPKPFIAVPTTAGTGSEVTMAAVIHNEERHIKMAFTSYHLYPHVAILDPAMTLTAPPKITAATGMDALTHAIEAYYCLQKNPVSDSFALAAIRLVMANLTTCVTDSHNDDARLAMANAALLAGISFSNSMVGVVHALAHACGGVCRVPHGVANAILLPWGMESNIAKVGPIIAELGPVLGADTSGNVEQRAYSAVGAVRALAERLKVVCGLPTTLHEAGVTEDALDAVARTATNDGAVMFNPEEVDFDAALAILKKAF